MRKLPRERKRIRALTAVTWLLALAIGLTWLASMGILTVMTAHVIRDRLNSQGMNFAQHVGQNSRLEGVYEGDLSQAIPQDELEYKMLTAITGYTNSYIGAGKIFPGPEESAILFYDGAGRLLHSSGENVLFFEYRTQTEWEAGAEDSGGRHYGWIDISQEDWNWESDLTARYVRFPITDTHMNTYGFREIEVIRVTGYFEGTELKPVILHYVTDGSIYWETVKPGEQQISVRVNGESYSLSQADRLGLLDWQLQFDRSDGCDRADLVTIYSVYPRIWRYKEKALRYGGVRYESLADLTERMEIPLYESYDDLRNTGKQSLYELLLFDKRAYAGGQALDWYCEGEQPADFILVTAFRCHPLTWAMHELRNIYIGSGLLALALFWAIRSRIKGNLLAPLAEVSDAIASGKTFYPEWRLQNRPPVWKEPYALLNDYLEREDCLQMRKNEITRLQTALDYAKTAEENRRQLTSNIAHELKTPLAVVHSYAEGLKDRIAEEKRDRYLDVILSETERMDGMVLEMLELSRLEAGKVKLARDQVSLGALARAVFEKLELAVQAKALRVEYLEYEIPADFTVTADESRIAQVIENFATNAVKYTPAGGQIWVKLQKSRSGVTFSIENESGPLSAEALDKVWDSFYRTDEARSGGGSGLGLAIAKSIVELHGGKCSAHNTRRGVEFAFTI